MFGTSWNICSKSICCNINRCRTRSPELSAKPITYLRYCYRSQTSLPPRKIKKESESMKLSGLNIGVALTGSFCTYDKIIDQIKRIVEEEANVIPIFSFNAQTIDSRFGKASDFIAQITEITGNNPILTISGAEPIGPKNLLDIIIIAPCTGNTLAKLCNGITDTPVLMAAKGHLRNQKPLVISLSTNDALGMNFKNVGAMLNCKNVFFVPFGQDDYHKKPNSMISKASLIVPTLESALDGIQLQPIIEHVC